MGNIMIREATVNDYRAIHDLNSYSFGYEFDLEATKKNIEHILTLPYYKLFVAEQEGKVVGYVQGSDYENTYRKPFKNIMAITVDTTLQGQGIGRMLLTRLEDWAKETGCAGVRLVSGHNRERAHIFYQLCGYVKRKEQSNFIKWFDE